MAEKLNKLEGGTWLQYSFSIWRDAQKNQEEWKLTILKNYSILNGLKEFNGRERAALAFTPLTLF